MNATPSCPSCGAPLSAASADGLCPACLLRAVLEAKPDEPAAPARHVALPRTFGPYELIEEIGRGGMGVVYRARQPTLGRTVAVKLLLSGAYASEVALRRFQLEAAAAAGLQHPNIVAIHDYGEVDGQPYYAMDLVTGRNLAELCDGRPLPARRAAELLHLLAGAVQYAHQCGIAHRDLKPSNVLIDEQGRPRISDFGLAKRIDSAAGVTAVGQALGSPSYTSPEQAGSRGGSIGIASDVYSLGALLYHLVTGRAPFNAATPTETLRLVLDTDPLPPRLLNPGLPRDLETICLKCLEKEPARRYTTAADLAEDMERFLSERPIRARPPNAFYRMRKFARRHYAGVAAVGITVLALAVGLAIALAGYRRAVVQRRAADAARGQAEGLVGLMTHDLTPALEQRGGLPQLLKTTEAAVHYYESLSPELRSTKTDQGQADALAALGRLRGRSLNDSKGAEAALRAALALREKIARENPDDPEAAAAWLLEECWMPARMGNGPSRITEARAEEFVRRGRELHQRFPDNLRVKQCLVQVLYLYATLVRDNYSKTGAAAAAAAQIQTLVEELLAAQSKEKAPPDWIGDNLNTLAEAWVNADALPDALPRGAAVSEQALAYCTDALKADPGNLKLREQTARAAAILSSCSSSYEKMRDAERIAREHYRVLIDLNPDDQRYRLYYAGRHMFECWCLFNRGPDFESAQKAFREYHALLEPFLHRGGYNDYAHWVRISNQMWLAVFAAWAGEPAEARREIEQAQHRFTDYCRWLPEGSFERCNFRVKFLSLKEYTLYSLRDWPAMAGAARDCLAEIEAGLRQRPVHGPLLLRQAEANAFLAVAAQHEGRPADAVARLRPAIEIMRTAPSEYSAVELHSILEIAEKALTESFVQQGNLEKARQAAEQLLLEFEIWRYQTLTEQDWEAGALTLAASLCESAEALRCIGLADRAKAMLTSPEAIGRLTVDGKENLATIARLQAEAAASLAPDALEQTGRQLDAAAATDPEASGRYTRAGESTWNIPAVSSAISSPAAREAELAAREGYRALMARFPENEAYRFLFAETHRMECYVHLGWDGQIEPARAAFRQYDVLLEPFVGRQGYDSVLRTRLFNSLHLAQLAASVGDKADANRWLEEARKRFEAYRDRSPKRSPDRGLVRVRFLEESAWSAWWLRDWPELSRLAQEAQAECEARLKEQPANEDLLKRRAMADGFAASALAGVGQSAEAATRLRAARDHLKTTRDTQSVYGVCDGDTVVWAIENAWIDVLRKEGDLAQARIWTDALLWAYEQWVPSFPEYWRAQKHLTIVRLQKASVLDPAIPFEAVKRKELLNQAAAVLAPDKVAGRLTVDVQEALRELERLRAPTVPQSP
ncbi:MAG TPA: protein kinase [Opitutaceae bacterium]|nr:protein kinase [Opitutaceae bacterium]